VPGLCSAELLDVCTARRTDRLGGCGPTSWARMGIEDQLEQWVRFACMLLGDEPFCAAEGLNEEQFVGSQEESDCYRL
jgi:hypothetical protein